MALTPAERQAARRARIRQMELDLECLRHECTTAQKLLDRALEIVQQVESGEKSPAVLQTAQGHLRAAQDLLTPKG